MASFNKVILVGNLTRDPELRFTPKGSAICSMGIAVNRTWTSEGGEKKEETTFIDVTTFGRSAENVSKYLKKGRPVLVEGRLRLEQWDDKKTGEKRSKMVVVSEAVQFLGGKESTPQAEAVSANTASDGFAKVKAAVTEPTEDDVPF